MAIHLDRLRSIQLQTATKEAALGTPGTVDSLIRMNAGIIPHPLVQTINDQDHIGASEEPTEAEVIARSLDFRFGQTRVKPHTLAWAAAFAMGSIATTTPTKAAGIAAVQRRAEGGPEPSTAAASSAARGSTAANRIAGIR